MSLANLASQVQISLYDGTSIVSTPNSFPIQQLRAGQTISYQGTADSTPALVSQAWSGSASELGHLWNSCGAPQSLASGGLLYWACNNGGGLHLQPNTLCYWTWNSGYTGPISVYINAVSQYSPGTFFLEHSANFTNPKLKGDITPLVPM